MGKDYNCTDAGNARFFRDYVKGNLIFNYRTQLWYEWTGFKWKACLQGETHEQAKRAIRLMHKHATDIEDKSDRHELTNWALKSESEPRLNAMLNLARSERGVADSGEQWDTDPMLLGCPRGVLDLRTGNFLAPDKKIKLMNSIVVDPEAGATAPRWAQFLQEVYQNDTELIAFIKRLLGYSLTGSVEEQCVFCFYGLGANGKSTLTDTLLSLTGNYGYAMPFSTVEFNTRSAISNDMAHLYGKRFVVASETQDGVRMNEGRLKSLTGGDIVTARFMYKEYFSFRPTAHFILSFNHKPIITDDSEGAWRRIRLVNHPRVFKPHERDKKLTDKLLAELPGILNWLIEGCLEWQRDGLNAPQSVMRATEDYRQEMNPIRQFVDECCVTGDFYIPVAELWDAYHGWADHLRERYKLSNRTFNARLEAMGFERKSRRVNGEVVKCWAGLTLMSDVLQTYGANAEPVC